MSQPACVPHVLLQCCCDQVEGSASGIAARRSKPLAVGLRLQQLGGCRSLVCMSEGHLVGHTGSCPSHQYKDLTVSCFMEEPRHTCSWRENQSRRR